MGADGTLAADCGADRAPPPRAGVAAYAPASGREAPGLGAPAAPGPEPDDTEAAQGTIQKGGSMIEIQNDGPFVVSTSYWQTEHARRGLLYVSVNAGAFRLLVPERLASEAPEMCRGAEYVIVTRGKYQGRDALEILFEDGSDSPYTIHVDARQVDRLPAPSDEGRTDLRLLVYVHPGMLVCELPARYRRVAGLPHLKPWGEK